MKRLLAAFRALRGRKNRGAVTVRATVLRADGTVEELGVVGKGELLLDPKGK